MISSDPFQHLDFSTENFSLEQKKFCAKVMAGAILSDGEIHEGESSFIQKFPAHYANDPQIVDYFQEFIDLGEAVVLEVFELNEELSIKLFNVVLLLVACDLDIHMNEIYFITNSARSLKIDEDTKKAKLEEVSNAVRDQIFTNLIKDLSEEQKRALGYIVSEAFPGNEQLGMIFRLLGQGTASDAKALDGDLGIDEEITESLINFLLDALMSNTGEWKDTDMEQLYKVGAALGYSEKRIQWFRSYVKTSFDLLYQ